MVYICHRYITTEHKEHSGLNSHVQISWFGHQVLMPHLYFLYSFWEGSLFSLFLSLFSFFLSQIDLGNTYRKESKNLFPCFSSQNKVNFGVLFVCLFICLFVWFFFLVYYFFLLWFSVVSYNFHLTCSTLKNGSIFPEICIFMQIRLFH